MIEPRAISVRSGSLNLDLLVRWLEKNEKTSVKHGVSHGRIHKRSPTKQTKVIDAYPIRLFAALPPNDLRALDETGQ